MANYEQFKQMYAANFHRLTDADGEQFWREFVDQCDGSILKEAIERLAEVAAMQKESGRIVTSPKLAEVKAQYWRMKHQAADRERTAMLGKSSCGFCDGTGDLIVMMHNRVIIDPHNPPAAQYPSLAWYAFPCLCEVGYARTPEGECPRVQRENAVKKRIPWQWTTKSGETMHGDVLAWKIIWDCERRYTEESKNNQIEQPEFED